jgi:hypothetical protein
MTKQTQPPDYAASRRTALRRQLARFLIRMIPDQEADHADHRARRCRPGADQLIGTPATGCCAFGSRVLLKLTDLTIGLRVGTEQEREGLDIVLHGEQVS